MDGVETKDWHDWIMKLANGADLGTWNVKRSHSPVGDVIGAGDERLLLTMSGHKLLAAIVGSQQKTAIWVCYCSLLGDCWKYGGEENDTSRAIAVASCPSSGKPFQAWPEDKAKTAAFLLASDATDAGAHAGKDAD